MSKIPFLSAFLLLPTATYAIQCGQYQEAVDIYGPRTWTISIAGIPLLIPYINTGNCTGRNPACVKAKLDLGDRGYTKSLTLRYCENDYKNPEHEVFRHLDGGGADPLAGPVPPIQYRRLSQNAKGFGTSVTPVFAFQF